jgi:hypothetical protein
MKNTKKRKLELLKVEKSMSLEKIRQTLTTYLTNQGLEIKKSNSEEEVKIMRRGSPAGTANLYDDNYSKSLGQSHDEDSKDE